MQGLARVLAGVDLALQLGYSPVKINVVLMKGTPLHHSVTAQDINTYLTSILLTRYPYIISSIP